jgi:hypothetical protein
VCESDRPSRRTSHVAFADLPPDPDDPLLGFAPYLHKAPRRNSITPDRQREFIAALAATGIVTQAARHIGASLEALYRLRHQPGAEGFSNAWEKAIDRGIARLEDCALELAIRGEELPIVSAGKLLGTYRKHNFGHIRFVLSQRRSWRYGPHAVQQREGEDARSEAEVLDSIDRMIDEMRERSLANAAPDQADDWDSERE